MNLLKMKSLSLFVFTIALINPIFIHANKGDSIKVEKLLAQSLKVVYSQPDSALFYCKEALKLEKKDLFLKSKSLNHLGIYYDVTSNNDSAIICYEQAIELAIKAKSEMIEASALNNLGLIYWNQAKYDLAIGYFNKSIVLFEKLDMKVGIASTLNNIGLIYNETKNYTKAIEYFHKSTDTYEIIKDKYGISATYTNLAISHHFLENFDSSFYYTKLSIPLKIEIDDNWGLAANYLNLATDFNQIGQSDSAVFYAQNSEILYRKLNNEDNLAAALSGKGQFLIELKRYKESNEALSEAELLAIETNSLGTLKNVYDHFSVLFFKQDDFKTAYGYLKKRLEIEEEIYSTEKDKAITEIQTKYETAKKDKEIAENKEKILKNELVVQAKNNQLLIAVGLVILLVAFAIFIFQFQLNKRKKLRLEFKSQEKINEANFNKELAEDKLRISRELHDNIGSHLTFLISSVDNLSFREESEDKKEKMQKISRFGKLTMIELRGTIWAMKNDSTSLNELYLRVLDLKENIETKLTITNQIKQELKLSSIQLLNLYRIIQEAIQNATKYAEANEIEVLFISNNEKIEITIKDDGKGFEMKEEYDSNGLNNMNYRANTIDAFLKIESELNKGTRITCTLSV